MYAIGDKVGEWIVVDTGSWGPHKYLLCEHECGARRKYSPHLLKEDHQECKKCQARAKYRKSLREIVTNAMYRSYKGSATKRGYSFNISKELFFELSFGNCAYCGVEPSTPKQIASKRRSPWHEGETVLMNGIDRIDNKRGYENDNVASCCATCNYAKREMSLSDWTRQVELWYTMIERQRF